MKVEADTGGMWPQAKGRPEPPGSGRGRKDPPLGLARGGACTTILSWLTRALVNNACRASSLSRLQGHRGPSSSRSSCSDLQWPSLAPCPSDGTAMFLLEKLP